MQKLRHRLKRNINLKDKTCFICPLVWLVTFIIVMFFVMLTCYATTDLSIDAIVKSIKVPIYCMLLIGVTAFFLFENKSSEFREDFSAKINYKDFGLIVLGAAGIALMLSGINFIIDDAFMLGFMGTPYSVCFKKAISEDALFFAVLAPVGQVLSITCLLFYPIRKKLNFIFTAVISGVLFCLPCVDYQWTTLTIIPMGIFVLYLIEKTRNISNAIIALQIYYLLTFGMYMIVDDLKVYIKAVIIVCGVICMSIALWINKKNPITYDKTVKSYSPREKLKSINIGIIILAVIEITRLFTDERIKIVIVFLLLITLLFFNRGKDYNKESNDLFCLEYIATFAYILTMLDGNIFWMSYVYGIAKLGSWIYLYVFSLSVTREEARRKRIKIAYTILICVLLFVLLINIGSIVMYDKEIFGSDKFARIITASFYVVSALIVKRENDAEKEEKEIE